MAGPLATGPVNVHVGSGSRPAATPRTVRILAGGTEPELVWHNELGGLTYRIGDRYVKWNPRSTGVDLDLEQKRLDWLEGRHPAPRVVSAGSDLSLIHI